MGGFRMKKVVLSLILALSAGLVLVSKPQASTSQSAVLFLRIAAGARAAGMGETFVAISDDATATHWNPAGLGEYPLNSQWVEFALPGYGQVRDAAAVKNGLPYEDANACDLWILTDKGLLVLGNTNRGSRSAPNHSAASQALGSLAASGRAANFVVVPTSGVSSISAAIRRYATFLTEDQADDLSARSTGHLMGIPSQELEPLLGRVIESIPPDYRDQI